MPKRSDAFSLQAIKRRPERPARNDAVYSVRVCYAAANSGAYEARRLPL